MLNSRFIDAVSNLVGPAAAMFMAVAVLTTPAAAEPGPKPAPAFTLPTLDGTPTSLSDYEGKVVMLNFWATWCAPCRKEMPAMQTLWERYGKDGFVILAVSEDEGEEKRIRRFIDKLALTFPILLDQDASLSDTYLLAGLPTTYLIGRDGYIHETLVGSVEWTDPEAIAKLEALLAK